MGRDKLHILLKGYHLLVPKYKRKTRTTNSRHGFRKYGNIAEELILTQVNSLWVSDITYIFIGGVFAFLNLVTDAYSHKIVGWCLSPTLETKAPIAILRDLYDNEHLSM